MGRCRSKRNESGAPRPLLRAFARAAQRIICCDPGMTTLKLGGHEPRRPFRGAPTKRQCFAEARDRWAKPGEAHLPTSTANPMRNAFAQHKEDDECPDMRLRETRQSSKPPPWPSDAPLCHVSKGADDALTPRMQNRLYIGAPTRVGKRNPRGRSGGRRRPSRPVEFLSAAVPGLRRR